MYKEHLDHGNYKNKFILAFDFIMEYKYPQVVYGLALAQSYW